MEQRNRIRLQAGKQPDGNHLQRILRSVCLGRFNGSFVGQVGIRIFARIRQHVRISQFRLLQHLPEEILHQLFLSAQTKEAHGEEGP